MSICEEATAVERSAMKKIRQRLYLYLAAGSFFTFLDRANISFAQLEMGRDLGLSATAFGFAAGIFFVGYTFLEIPSNILLEKIGTRKWMTPLFFLWGITTVLTGFTQNDYQLFVLRFMLGVFEAGAFPGMVLMINYWFRSNSMGAATSVLLLGGGIASALGAPFAGWMLGLDMMGLPGWRWLFLLEGAVTCVWAVFTLTFIADGPETAGWLSRAEKEWLAGVLAEDRAANVGPAHSITVWAAVVQPKILLFLLGYTLFGFCYWMMLFFMPTLIKAVGQALDNQVIGWLAFIPNLLGMLVLLYWGRHADAHNERHWHIVVPLVLAIVGFACFPAATTPLVAVIAICAVVMGLNGFQVNFWPAANMLVGRKAVAASTAIINMGAGIGGFVGPYYLGWSKDMTGSFTFGMVSCVAALFVNLVIMHVFFTRRKAALSQIKPAK
ncbi:MFS transporter [Shumkonia mesophila]|uniref:MFS transporter n=1 Tax=Shumkonia mesophila TaxID=2838854 RepID=UPI00293467C2|nr:MFS transporter [Shumkonia mesophila]